MFDFIPIEYYTYTYYYVMIFIVLITFLLTQSSDFNSTSSYRFQRSLGLFMLVFILLYMGLRPVNGVFIDMITYSYMFERYIEDDTFIATTDILFNTFTMLSSKIMNVNAYFFVCAILYVVPLYLVCKKWLKNNWFYGFLFLVLAFTFWSYGTNGIRNGIASSLFLYGISRDKRVFQVLWIILAISFHKTMVLPAIGFVFANFYNQPKKMIIFWMLCIILSLGGGGFFESFFGSLGFEDDRMSYLTDEVEEGRFAYTGFRWDFLVYSSVAVFSGWYYIVKLKFNDKVYFLLFNTYVFANAFWILVIRANFSNRFAYLSWFMFGLVIVYPLLKKKIISRQHQKIGIIFLFYFLFTFFMNVFLN